VIDYRTLRVWECIAEYAAAHNTPVSLDTVCASCVMRTAMSGAWVTWNHPARRPLYATDLVAERVADLHFLLGEGPARDAARLGRPVTAADLTSAASRRTWPVFAGAAQAAGVRTVVAVPLLVSELRIGLFGMCSRYPIALSAEQTAEMEGFAEIALGLVLDRLPAADVDRWIAREAEVHQACGIVSVQLGVGVDESLLRLRARAFSEGRPLSEIAHEVVTRRLHFSPDSSKPPP
jgi:GAF domain